MSKVEINILMGLPGSGKSTWRIKNTPSINNRFYGRHSSFCCDDYLWNENCTYNYGRYKTIPEIIKRNLDIDRDSEFVCIDGLFTTNTQIQEVIDVVHTCLPKFRNDEDFVIVIHHWKEDREACLHNDKYRRELSSTTSIKNLYILKQAELVENAVALKSAYQTLNNNISNRLTQIVYKLKHCKSEVLDKTEYKLNLIHSKLIRLNPHSILKLGYATLKNNQKHIMSVNDVNVGDIIEINIKDGMVTSVVNDVTKKGD